MRLQRLHTALLGIALVATASAAPPIAPQTAPPKAVALPGIEVDRAARQVRVECLALGVEAPLEFFCVTEGGPEHESVLRTAAKPSHIHAALLMLGLEPGSPAKYSETRNAWSAPFGPPVLISVEWTTDAGTSVRKPAERLMRSIKDKQPAPAQQFIFAGSHQRADGAYLADLTGYVVSICNFEHTLIDVPRLVSNANETLLWEADMENGPKGGTKVTMIIEPVEPADAKPSAPTTHPTPEEADAQAIADEQREIAALRDKWRATVKPHEAAMHDAAKTHYEMLKEIRIRQQKLIDEADRLQLLIDELEKEYQAMTTPKP